MFDQYAVVYYTIKMRYVIIKQKVIIKKKNPTSPLNISYYLISHMTMDHCVLLRFFRSDLFKKDDENNMSSPSMRI